ncbi:MAG: response regulator [Bacteroidota bacterium]
MNPFAKHILLVDDNRTDAELTTFAIRKVHKPVHISWVESGEQALDFIRRTNETAHQIDLMILDLTMPNLDGFGVLTHLQQDQLKHFPVVMYSGSKKPEDEQRARELGAEDYFSKPFDYFTNLRLFETICGRWLMMEKMV